MKKFCSPVIFVVIFALCACSNPLLEWIETENQAGTSLYTISSGIGITDFTFGITDEEVIIRPRPPGINTITPITVILPAGTPINDLSPSIGYIGKYILPASGISQNFTSPVPYTVYGDNGSSRPYEVSVIVKVSNVGEIIWFDLELPNGSMAEGEVNQSAGTITIHVPNSGTPTTLKAKIVQTGDFLTDPYTSIHSGVTVDFTDDFASVSSYSKTYKVTAEDATIKSYTVTVIKDLSADTGIFDFQVYKDAAFAVPIPNAHVVIGQHPRSDGKIPIVIQVPFGTDEEHMYAKIDLGHPGGISPGSGLITFTNQERFYTVTAEDGTTQDYVAVVSEGPQYYYVSAGGDDTWPDYYNGGSKDRPFGTLAYAVQRAAKDGIEKVLIMDDLIAPTGGGSASSTFDIDLSSISPGPNKEIIINSSDPLVTRTLQASTGKRVLNITGGAKLTFKNIDVTGGDVGAKLAGDPAGNGGGIAVSGNSTVNFSGNITGNRARSGGGVYVEDTGSDESAFILEGGGTIANNTATGNTSGDPNLDAMEGGGGVYLKGNADFWLYPNGTISGNTATNATTPGTLGPDGSGGAGGGVLVNTTNSTDYGLVMSGGQITGNRSTSSTYPHGGGGVYVARGAFEMSGGEITGNTAKRQGGGVFVHWGDARFTAWGTSKITGNEGVGSSKAICNRGTTALLGDVTADRVYVWDYGESPAQSFTLADNVNITTGMAFARSSDKGTGNKNFITLVDDGTHNFVPGTNTILIDLESHLEQGTLSASLDGDWPGQKILEGNNGTLTTMLNHFTLNTFTGNPSVYSLYNNYKIVVSGTDGTFEHK
ncbi:MAG: hypothetical protein LBJ31_00460 [Treponema sp.]|jgi:hypothetical protein|nr:hypothetical protein [Treponema sp.]